MALSLPGSASSRRTFTLLKFFILFLFFFLYSRADYTLSVTHTHVHVLSVSLSLSHTLPLPPFSPASPFLPPVLPPPPSCLLLFYPPLSLPPSFHLLCSLFAPGDRLCGNLHQLFKVSPHFSFTCDGELFRADNSRSKITTESYKCHYAVSRHLLFWNNFSEC